MASTNYYSSMTLDELRAEEKKQKSYRIPSALFLGFLVGIAVFAAVKGKFFLVIMVLAGVIFLANRSGDALKKVQAEIKSRPPGRCHLPFAHEPDTMTEPLANTRCNG